MDVKNILWAFTHKLKDAFPIVSISFDEVDDRPTSIEHHGGVDYDKIPERY
jgi:cytochrome oxidase Cu insertion factor (SCO1/SenC/PrrC family)